MWIVFAHAWLGATLFGAVLFDALFVRSKSALALQPEELLARWRKRLGLYEMFAFLGIFTLGLIQWMPRVASYPPGVFHAKMGLAVVFIVLGKVRMLKERKGGAVQYGLTKAMAVVVTAIFSIGLAYSAGLFSGAGQ